MRLIQQGYAVSLREGSVEAPGEGNSKMNCQRLEGSVDKNVHVTLHNTGTVKRVTVDPQNVLLLCYGTFRHIFVV